MSEQQAVYKAPRISEHDEQASFVAEVSMRYASRDDFIPTLLFAVPNGAWLGGANPHALMAKYRKEGFRNGVADLIYLQPRGPYSFLCIEMKAQDQRNKRDGGLSEEQATFLAAVSAAGGCADTCYGAEHAMIVFSAYMSEEVRA